MAGLGACWVVVEHDEAVDCVGGEDLGDLVLGVGGILGGELGESVLARNSRILLGLPLRHFEGVYRLFFESMARRAVLMVFMRRRGVGISGNQVGMRGGSGRRPNAI